MKLRVAAMNPRSSRSLCTYTGISNEQCSTNYTCMRERWNVMRITAEQVDAAAGVCCAALCCAG